MAEPQWSQVTRTKKRFDKYSHNEKSMESEKIYKIHLRGRIKQQRTRLRNTRDTTDDIPQIVDFAELISKLNSEPETCLETLRSFRAFVSSSLSFHYLFRTLRMNNVYCF